MNNENSGKPLTKEDFDLELNEHYEKSVELDKIQQENKEMNARIQNQKMRLQMTELERITKIQEDLEHEDLSERKFERHKMLKDIEDRKNAVTFLNARISEDLVAAPGSLIVIPSMTNNGKSTLTAHLAEALVNEGKKVLILSNEEKEQDVRARISCLRTETSFGDYKTNKCSAEEFERVLDDAEELANSKKLVVISTDNDIDAYKVTTVKGVMTTLERAKNVFDAVILDYFTNVNMSEMGTQDPWHVNNRLASQLNIFKDSATFPLIVFSQCESIKTDKKVENKSQLDFESNHPRYRWIGGKGIILYATDIIELTRDFPNSCSYLFAHKVRFGHGDLQRTHMLPFDKKMQRFVPLTPEWDAQATRAKVVNSTKERSKDVDLSNIFESRK